MSTNPLLHHAKRIAQITSNGRAVNGCGIQPASAVIDSWHRCLDDYAMDPTALRRGHGAARGITGRGRRGGRRGCGSQPDDLVGAYRTDWDVGLAVAAGNDKLKTVLADTMDQLQQDGTLKQIFNTYGVEYVPSQGELGAITSVED